LYRSARQDGGQLSGIVPRGIGRLYCGKETKSDKGFLSVKLLDARKRRMALPGGGQVCKNLFLRHPFARLSTPVSPHFAGVPSPWSSAHSFAQIPIFTRSGRGGVADCRLLMRQAKDESRTFARQ
jgi:hypothetical protein